MFKKIIRIISFFYLKKKKFFFYLNLTFSILFLGIKLLKLYSMKTLLRADRARILFIIRMSDHVYLNIAIRWSSHVRLRMRQNKTYNRQEISNTSRLTEH